jgi:hypothetical protein
MRRPIRFLPGTTARANRRSSSSRQVVTRQGGADFVAPDERAAGFGNGGTLWPDHPMYFQLAFAIDRVKAMAALHPEWTDKQPFKAV